MAHKKIVFIIVEGPSDDTALGYFIDKRFDENTVYVEVMHKDITIQKEINNANAKRKITEIVKAYADNNHYTPKHFQEIIHIVDTDGTFIQPKYIIENCKLKNIQYTEENIICKSKKDIEERNKKKSSIIMQLQTCHSLWKSIPYHIYYMSSCLDHVLYNKMNSSDTEKENDSFNFLKLYKNNIEGFSKFISDSDFSDKGTYDETWNFIQKDLNSLNRHTNIGLIFKN